MPQIVYGDVFSVEAPRAGVSQGAHRGDVVVLGYLRFTTDKVNDG